ncbi:far upstream element-binding protein 2-like isoform X1 [Punica granatum]|uniref:Far upstream element-binding protein 2-like isoform X1 n=1 Tax=Punica granatum TaxID=22663 RepID=A0A6P8CT87_PUNGR|nr:far upstream element-binding protein 2-like isoform X1 [Punica granatum]
MAEEDIVAPPHSDHKRKLEDLEPEAPQPPTSPMPEEPSDAHQDTALVAEPPSSPDVKRPRLDDASGNVASENGHQDKKADESSNGEQENVENSGAEDADSNPRDSKDASDDGVPAADNNDVGDFEPSAIIGSQTDNTEEPPLEEAEPASDNVLQQANASMLQQQDHEPITDSGTISRKIEVPNDKVGVLIGKGGETVRSLQSNSGAKIQIVRDADADMACSMRPVELIGSLESISKAEKLIRDVIAEADAGGSPSLVARGFGSGQNAGAAEQFEMKVPNEKVGLIIGRGGDTIKGLQTKSGARIQLIPQQPTGGDESKERTVRVTGYKRQIDIAIEMIKDVMKQLPKPSHLSGSYRQQAYQSRGGPPAQWGPPRGPPYPSQPMMGYDYQQQRGGPYPSQNPQYPPSYNPPAPPQLGPRQSGFGFGWDQRPPPHGGNNYDFYGGHGPNAQALGSHSGPPIHGHAAGPPQPQANYNYGPSTQGPPEYGHSAPYSSQPVPTHQSYGHSGYEAKYESAPPSHSYGSSQPVYSQAAPQSGYYTQQQYGKPPVAASYGMNPNHPPQSYGNPRGNQPGGDAMTGYHLGSSNQLYGSQQQVYPSSYPAVTEQPPMQQQQQQTSYPMYPTDGQGQGGAAGYGSYPSSVQQAAGYPTTEQQATAYHHQAAATPQDPGAVAAAAASYTQLPQQQQHQQQQAGFTQQPPPAAQATSYPSQYDSTTQQAYGGPPAAR